MTKKKKKKCEKEEQKALSEKTCIDFSLFLKPVCLNKNRNHIKGYMISTCLTSGDVNLGHFIK